MSSFNRPKFIFVMKDPQQFIIRDHRGFDVFVVNAQGDFKHKGKQVKLT